MSRLNVVIVALVAFAVGALLGLGFAALTQGDLREVEAERDRIAEEKAHADLDVQRFQKELKTATANHEETMDQLLHAEAFIGLVNQLPEHRDVFLGDHFQRTYKADWYWPNVAFDLLGGKWLVDDMTNQGFIDPSILEQASVAEAAGWKTTQVWQIRGMKSTESFEVDCRLWRVRWETEADNFVSITVHRSNGDIVANACGNGSDESTIRARPGRFYLTITTIGGTANIFVQRPNP